MSFLNVGMCAPCGTLVDVVTRCLSASGGESAVEAPTTRAERNHHENVPCRSSQDCETSKAPGFELLENSALSWAFSWRPLVSAAPQASPANVPWSCWSRQAPAITHLK